MKKYPHELIGKMVTIIKSKNKSDEGLSGKVLDETKKTLVLSGSKTVFKKNITLKLNSGEIISGDALMGRSEERVKG